MLRSTGGCRPSFIVQTHNPDVIFFQEVTPYIRSIFESFAWWKDYQCSPVSPEELATGQHFCLLMSKYTLANFARWKFPNSPTGRSYLEAEIYPGLAAGTKPIRVATTQLEFATPPAPMRCLERYAQADHAVTALSSTENVVFGGDMCWRDDTDRPFPLLVGWYDAWPSDRGDQAWTYNSFWNEEVVLFNGFSRWESLMNRSDRFLCKLKHYQLDNMVEMVGDERIGLEYRTPSASRELPPSCHRGLVFTIVLVE